MSKLFETTQSVTGYLIEPILVFLILFSPLIYGSVCIIPLTVIEISSLLLLSIFIISILSREKISVVKIRAIPLLLFLIFVLFQITPLSKNLIAFLSPSTDSLYQQFKVNYRDGVTLSIYPEVTVKILLQLLSYLAAFFVTLNYADSERKIRRIILIIIISGVLYSLYGIVRRIYTPFSGFSTFANRSHFAAYVEMIIPVCLAYSLIEESKTRRAIFIFLTSVMGLAVFLSISRAGIICFIISMALFLFILRIKTGFKRAIAVALALVLFISLFLMTIKFDMIAKRISTLALPEKAFYGRSTIYNDSLNILSEFPFLGTGLGTFGDIAEKYKTLQTYKRYVFAHNEPLQLLVETGFVGAILLALFFIMYLNNAVKSWLKRHSRFSIYVGLGMFIGLFSVILHSFFEFLFHIPADALLFFIILALVYKVVSLSTLKDQETTNTINLALPATARVSIISAFLIIFVYIGCLVLKRCEAEALFRDIEDGAIIKYDESLKGISRAVELNPLNSNYPDKKASIIKDLLVREDLKNEFEAIYSAGGQKEAFKLAEALYIKAIDINPARPEYHKNLAELYAAVGFDSQARAEFEKADLLDPQAAKSKK